MANFKGANLRYDNSDEQDRKYDISAEAVLDGGRVTAVRNIVVSGIDGTGNGSGNVNGIGNGFPDVNISLSGIVFEGQKEAADAIFDFAASIVAEAESGNEGN